MGVKPDPLTLAEHRLRMGENRLLRQVFGPKMDEVTVEWGKMLRNGFMIYIGHRIIFR
jgi:hypothetical protein